MGSHDASSTACQNNKNPNSKGCVMESSTHSGMKSRNRLLTVQLLCERIDLDYQIENVSYQQALPSTKEGLPSASPSTGTRPLPYIQELASYCAVIQIGYIPCKRSFLTTVRSSWQG
jgi:hypothetical protein